MKWQVERIQETVKMAKAPKGKQRTIRSDDDRLADALRKKEQLEAQIAKLKSTKTAKDVYKRQMWF